MAKKRVSHADKRSMLTHKQETMLAIESVPIEKIQQLGRDLKSKLETGKKSDNLKTMFDLQKDFQNMVGNKKKIFQDEPDTEFIKESIISIIAELMEVLNETPWKPWKKNQLSTHKEHVREEIIDVWHFLINLSMAAGMDEKTVFELFLKKNEINRKRQEDGK